MRKVLLNIGVPTVLILGFFVVMSNFKHTDELSKSEKREIAYYVELQEEATAMKASAKKEKQEEEENSENHIIWLAYNEYGPISKGASGEHIEAIQALLGLEPDGEFGESTEKAIMNFQWQIGAIVDGVVGPKTIEELLKKSNDIVLDYNN